MLTKGDWCRPGKQRTVDTLSEGWSENSKIKNLSFTKSLTIVALRLPASSGSWVPQSQRIADIDEETASFLRGDHCSKSLEVPVRDACKWQWHTCQMTTLRWCLVVCCSLDLRMQYYPSCQHSPALSLCMQCYQSCQHSPALSLCMQCYLSCQHSPALSLCMQCYLSSQHSPALSLCMQCYLSCQHSPALSLCMQCYLSCHHSPASFLPFVFRLPSCSLHAQSTMSHSKFWETSIV